MRVAYVVSGLAAGAGTAIIALSGAVSAEPSQASERSPLADYLGFGYNADQEEALYLEEEAQRQSIIKQCMNAAGFEYWPRPIDPSSDSLPHEDNNQAYRDALTPAAAEAYWRSLSGRSADDAMSDDEMTKLDPNADGRIDFAERAPMGCLGKAESSVPGVFHVHGVLREELRDLYDQITGSAAAKVAYERYVDCMNEVGVPGADLDEVRSNLVDMVLGDQAANVDLSASNACDTTLEVAMHPIRVEAETRFFDANKATVEELAVRVG